MKKMQFKTLLLLFLLTLSTSLVYAQNTFTGVVKDAKTGETLIGANVLIKGSSVGTITDYDGKFSLSGPNNSTLVVSYIGYAPQEVAAKAQLVIELGANTLDLNEVIVVGYGSTRKKDLTGSVSSVGTKDFNPGLMSSPAELLNGKVAGVQIISNSGSPTSGSSIRIRGGASLNASNDPLIVVDGVPLESGGITGSGDFLSLINPNDIENMTILKDASSTAIYGSRASNGVVLITTKKANKNDDIRVNISSNSSFQTKTNNIQMLNETQFREAVRQRGIQDNSVSKYQSWLGNEWVNWNDQIFQTAAGTDNNISISGSINKKMPFRASFGYMYQDGILKNDNYQRYTGSVQLSPSFFKDHLKLNLSVKGAINDNKYANTDAIYAATVFNPTLPVKSGNNLYGGYTQSLDNSGNPVNERQTWNPLSLLDRNQEYHTGNVKRIIGNFDIDYKMHFLPELRAHLSIGVDAAEGKQVDQLYEESIRSYYTTDQAGYYSTDNSTNMNTLVSAYLNYNKEVESIKSTFDVTAGYDYQDWVAKKYGQYTMKPNMQDTTWVGNGDYQRHLLLSFYGRFHYSYDSRYMITATIRGDGTSRFASQNRWGIFPSVAFAWSLKNEEFLKNVEAVNDLKLRLGWGVTGQQDGIGNYGYLGVYDRMSTTKQYQFGNGYYNAYVPTSYDSNLKWETTSSYNAGIDFAFIQNKLNGSIDYYNRNTKDLIATVNAPAGANITNTITTNVGNLVSQGIELSLNASLIQTKDWDWNVGANFTYQTQQIVSLNMAQSPGIYTGPSAGAESGRTLQIMTEGYAPYMFYVKKQVYDQNGRPIEGLYADINGDGTVDNQDYYRYHSPSPDYIVGFNTSIRWKKLTLSAVFRSNIGNYVYNNTRATSYAAVSYLDGVLNNLNADFANSEFKTQQPLSDYYMENASFLKMENISLSYNFGRLGKKVDLRIGALIQNVFTVTKYTGIDPEVSTGFDNAIYPRPRIYSLNFNLSF